MTVTVFPLDGSTLVRGGFNVGGTVLVENGTLICGTAESNSAGDGNPSDTGVLGLVNATMDLAGPMGDPSLLVGLIGASHLNLQPFQFISPIVLASTAATINVANLTDFAGVCFDAKTSMGDFVSHSNVIEASMRVYDDIPGTTWTASVANHGGTETVTLGISAIFGHHV